MWKSIDRERRIPMVRRLSSPNGQTRILVVEDDSTQRERARAWLEPHQCLIREAANGRESLASIREEKPDIILLDLMMPEMDGCQVVARLQKDTRWSDSPVSVVTAMDLTA